MMLHEPSRQIPALFSGGDRTTRRQERAQKNTFSAEAGWDVKHKKRELTNLPERYIIILLSHPGLLIRLSA